MPLDRTIFLYWLVTDNDESLAAMVFWKGRWAIYTDELAVDIACATAVEQGAEQIFTRFHRTGWTGHEAVEDYARIMEEWTHFRTRPPA